jgi:pimeloyl-ACP methyl ester carboxylesterase
MFVDGHTFDGMIPALARDRRLVVVDGPGLGLSDPLTRRSAISEAAAAARDVIGALDAGPVDWIGHAFGGHVGLKLAQHEGVLRSLVAVSAPTESIDDALRRQIRLLLPIVRTVGARGPIPGVVRKAMLTDASAARPEVRAVVDASLARPNRRSLALAIGFLHPGSRRCHRRTGPHPGTQPVRRLGRPRRLEPGGRPCRGRAEPVGPVRHDLRCADLGAARASGAPGRGDHRVLGTGRPSHPIRNRRIGKCLYASSVAAVGQPTWDFTDLTG